ncbi:hypothetical protein FSP39_007339 [Pinctada imbricata]|uniref:Farnesoic acid O-methyl transferase domain-containing protein n=1 Tax=Pinctada imbricata TaxID=66713 RepID=A0AA88YAW2_PINIB|nr:hypothetical protein FSP39_007339 [Pinctada imbricata]
MTLPSVSSLVFKVKGCKDAILHLGSRDEKYKYKIGIENGSGTFSKITKLFFGNESLVYKVVQNDTSGEDLIACHSFKTIWLLWDNTSIMLGSDEYLMENMFMSGSDNDLIAGLKLLNIRSYGKTNLTWIFQGNDTEWRSSESTSLSTQIFTSPSWLMTIFNPSAHIDGSTSSITTEGNVDDATNTLISTDIPMNFGRRYSALSTVTSSNSAILTKVQTTTITNSNKYDATVTSTLSTAETDVTSATEAIISENMCQCSCPKHDQDLEKRLQEIRKILLLNKTTLTLNIRKKYSAPDSRVSSRYLGYLGIAVIVCVCVLIVMADLTRVSKQYKK